MTDFAAQRRDYVRPPFTEADADPNPFTQFGRWMQDAVSANIAEPNAMTLATAHNGTPSARMVLLKTVDEHGFVFFTNYDSRKARELSANPQAALVFFWQALSRQVRVIGAVEKVSAAESDAYFQQRPLEAQLGAWASAQSAVLPNRAALEAEFARISAQYGAGPVPRPPHWGGYRVIPNEIEFWQGGQHRLHDRLLYQRTEPGWSIVRLAP